MSNDLDKLLEQYEDGEGALTGEGDLKVISALANQQMMLEAQLEAAKIYLAELQEAHRDIAQNVLPEAMAACGIKEFTLSDGSKVTVRDDVSTSLKADNKDGALDWLEANGHDSIIKHEVTCSFDRGENSNAEAALELLQTAGFTPTDKQAVNHQTLQAWGRRMAEEGIRPPEEFFHSFDIHIAKIKAPKK
jgi:hypothetical protein